MGAIVWFWGPQGGAMYGCPARAKLEYRNATKVQPLLSMIGTIDRRLISRVTLMGAWLTKQWNKGRKIVHKYTSYWTFVFAKTTSGAIECIESIVFLQFFVHLDFESFFGHQMTPFNLAKETWRNQATFLVLKRPIVGHLSPRKIY